MEESKKKKVRVISSTKQMFAKIVSPIRCAHAGAFLLMDFSPFPASASASITIAIVSPTYANCFSICLCFRT